MSDNKNAGVALGASALIASAIALIKVRQASADPLPSAGELGLDEATTDLLIAIAQTGQNIDTNVYNILVAMAEVSGGGSGILQNPRDFTAFTSTPIAINTALRLPPKPIPYRHSLVIKAYHTNGGVIYVAHNAADCVNVNSSYPLIANEAVELQIRNAETAWISSTVVGDSVACIVELEQV